MLGMTAVAQHDAQVHAEYDDCLSETNDTILVFPATPSTTVVRS